MNILLTGNVQVGKSTAIDRFLEAKKPKVCGFRTFHRGEAVKIYEEGGSGEYICALGKREKLVPIPSSFERAASEFLDPKEGADLYLMDELGTLEGKALGFQKKILEILDAPIPVLGVIKPKSSPFLDAIREREDVLLIEVDEENREEVYKKLLSLDWKREGVAECSAKAQAMLVLGEAEYRAFKKDGAVTEIARKAARKGAEEAELQVQSEDWSKTVRFTVSVKRAGKKCPLSETLSAAGAAAVAVCTALGEENIVIENIRLLEHHGGAGGDWYWWKQYGDFDPESEEHNG